MNAACTSAAETTVPHPNPPPRVGREPFGSHSLDSLGPVLRQPVAFHFDLRRFGPFCFRFATFSTMSVAKRDGG